MEEQEFQNSSNDQVAPEANVSHETTKEVEQQQAQQVEDRQEKNWRAVREKQKELERELVMQKEMNEKLLKLATQNTPKAEELDPLDKIADDEYISAGKVKQLVSKQAAKIAQEIAQKEAEKLMKQQEQSQFLVKLKSKYPDFQDVVTPETLALLEDKNPELANTIAEIQDPYKMGLQSYEYIKALGIASDIPNARRAKEVEKKISENAKTVQSPQAYDKRPMAQAYRITEQEKQKLYEEMSQYASMAGSVPELR